MRELKNRRAPTAAIEYAVEVLEQMQNARSQEEARLAEMRLAATARKRVSRQNARAGVSRDSHVTVTPQSQSGHAPVTGQSHAPSPSPLPSPDPIPLRSPTHALPHAHARPTLEQAKGWNGSGNPIPMQTVELWWNTREAADWHKANAAGQMVPVLAGKERNDLAAFHIAQQNRQNEGRLHTAHYNGPRSGNGGTAFTSAKAEARHAPENLTRPENRPPKAPTTTTADDA